MICFVTAAALYHGDTTHYRIRIVKIGLLTLQANHVLSMSQIKMATAASLRVPDQSLLGVMPGLDQHC